MYVLTVNAGSSSLKLRLLDPGDAVLEETAAETGPDGFADALGEFVRALGRVDAVGHRVVHGGPDMRTPTRIDGVVEERIRGLTPLAPQHQPAALAGIRAAREALPDVPMVACLDTTFHRTMPAAAAVYALPEDWRKRWALRRYGFHGLSHAYASRRAAEMLGRDPADLRMVSCHVGAGASLCAIAAGQSVDTTMGMTPLEGLVMARRSGTVDPGLLLWLTGAGRLTPQQLRRGLEESSGLAALSGGLSDIRDVLAASERGDGRATLAFDVYVHRLVRETGAMVAVLGGLDALVFTGGVGEHSAEVRAAATARLGHLGIRVDEQANRDATGGDHDITVSGVTPATLVVEAREDLEIARETRHVLTRSTRAA